MKKSTKIALVVTILALNFLFSPLLSLGQSTQNNLKFAEIYRQALVLNQDRFPNLNQIQIGDTVLFPSRSGQGIEAWIANQPVNGRHDCIWWLADRYINGLLETSPADTVRIKVSIPSEIEIETETKRFNWRYLLAALALLSVLAFLATILWTEFQKKRNPSLYPPVGGNLDNLSHKDATEAIRRQLKPGERIVRLQRGTLKRHHGPRHLCAQMEFGDNVVRNVWIKPEERVTRIWIEKDGLRRMEYYRSACSNGLLSGRFTIASGWEFLPDSTEENDGQVASVTDGDNQKATKKSENLEALERLTRQIFDLPEADPLTALSTIISNLPMDKGNNININYHEKANSLKLSIKVSGNKEKKAE